MAPLLNKLEQTLEPVFKNLPALPKSAKDWLAKAWPVLALIFGALQLLAAWSLWHVGHTVDQLVNMTNDWARAYGVNTTVNHLSIMYWLALVFLVVDALILLMAYSGLKQYAKRGWDMLFLGATLNLVYGVLTIFDSTYGGASKLFSALVGSAVGYYILFQMRDYYTGKAKVAKTAKTVSPKVTK